MHPPADLHHTLLWLSQTATQAWQSFPLPAMYILPSPLICVQAIVGMSANSREELMQRVQQAVGEGKVEVVHVTVATQRRSVLEAVAFGTFLRDVETHVDTEYALLTPAPTSPRGPGGGGGGMSGVA